MLTTVINTEELVGECQVHASLIAISFEDEILFGQFIGSVFWVIYDVDTAWTWVLKFLRICICHVIIVESFYYHKT